MAKYGYIVEGFNDELNLLKIQPEAMMVVLKGTRLDNRIRQDIQKALNHCEQVFLLTDPDEAGDLIANKVLAEYPFLTRIHLERKEALCFRNNKWKVGVEHCTQDYLKSVLKGYGISD